MGLLAQELELPQQILEVVAVVGITILEVLVAEEAQALSSSVMQVLSAALAEP